MAHSKITTMVWLHCETCHEPFLVKRSQQIRLKNCSYKCKGLAKTRNHSVSLECKNCHEQFLAVPSSRKKHDHAFCSPNCSASYNAKNRVKDDGWRSTQEGYVFRYEKGVKVFQHRLVMQEVLGRELLKNENVHHINGIKSDNSPENLELWSVPQPKGQRVSDLLLASKRPAGSSWVTGLLYC